MTFAIILYIVVVIFTWAQLTLFQRTRIRAALYLGLGGLFGFATGVADYVDSARVVTATLAGAGVLITGWGFARASTIDVGRWQLVRGRVSIARFMTGAYRQQDLSRAPDYAPSLRVVVGYSSFLFAAALVTWFLQPRHRFSVAIFAVFGIQLVLAGFMARRRRNA